MRVQQPGRHELGQNFLVNKKVIASFVKEVARTEGPIVEIGPGQGALTIPMAKLGRPITAIEIDPRRVAELQQRANGSTTVIHRDFLQHRLPPSPHVVAGNLPFHLTTAVLRRLLAAPGWTTSVLIMQWEVARRRAGIGGSTMMTAQWAPWFEFELVSRVPRNAFRPMPNVDAGILLMHRRSQPQLPLPSKRAFQSYVKRVFTGRGQGLAQILSRATPGMSQKYFSRWMQRNGISPQALPKSLSVQQWVSLFQLDQQC